MLETPLYETVLQGPQELPVLRSLPCPDIAMVSPTSDIPQAMTLAIVAVSSDIPPFDQTVPKQNKACLESAVC